MVKRLDEPALAKGCPDDPEPEGRLASREELEVAFAAAFRRLGIELRPSSLTVEELHERLHREGGGADNEFSRGIIEMREEWVMPDRARSRNLIP